MTGCLGFVWGILLPSYVGIERNHDKDPYSPTSTMESRAFFFRRSTERFWCMYRCSFSAEITSLNATPLVVLLSFPKDPITLSDDD